MPLFFAPLSDVLTLFFNSLGLLCRGSVLEYIFMCIKIGALGFFSTRQISPVLLRSSYKIINVLSLQSLFTKLGQSAYEHNIPSNRMAPVTHSSWSLPFARPILWPFGTRVYLLFCL